MVKGNRQKSRGLTFDLASAAGDSSSIPLVSFPDPGSGNETTIPPASHKNSRCILIKGRLYDKVYTVPNSRRGHIGDKGRNVKDQVRVQARRGRNFFGELFYPE